MANTHSAEKRNRQTIKRTARNVALKSEVKTAVKKAREALATGDATKAKQALAAATRVIDRAATKGVLHAKNASRRIARLSHNISAKFAAPAK